MGAAETAAVRQLHRSGLVNIDYSFRLSASGILCTLSKRTRHETGPNPKVQRRQPRSLSVLSPGPARAPATSGSHWGHCRNRNDFWLALRTLPRRLTGNCCHRPRNFGGDCGNFRRPRENFFRGRKTFFPRCGNFCGRRRNLFQRWSNCFNRRRGFFCHRRGFRNRRENFFQGWGIFWNHRRNFFRIRKPLPKLISSLTSTLSLGERETHAAVPGISGCSPHHSRQPADSRSVPPPKSSPRWPKARRIFLPLPGGEGWGEGGGPSRRPLAKASNCWRTTKNPKPARNWGDYGMLTAIPPPTR